MTCITPLHPRQRLALRAALIAAVASWTGAPARAFDGTHVLIPGGGWNMEAGPIPYALDPAGSDDIEGDADLDAVRDAFRAWECVEGVSLRFVEDEGPGPAAIDDSDGKNTLFWDETGEYGLGPATLGVTVGDAGGGFRAQADIVFNGFDSTWSTNGSGVDVTSIALHEIGHLVGLDHPCDKGPGGAETNCNGPERSVMTPAWGGVPERAPLPDDEEGVRALYPLGPEEAGGCDGPARKGERCSCDDDCVEGLLCAGPAGDQRVCAPPCATDAADCGPGFLCVLDAADGDRAEGVCQKAVGTGAPAGAICQQSSQCASGACTLVFDLVRSLCEEGCDSEADCAGGACVDGFCLSPPLHEECPAPPSTGCGCETIGGSAVWSGRDDGMLGATALALLASRVAWARRRRRTARGAMGTESALLDGGHDVPEARR